MKPRFLWVWFTIVSEYAGDYQVAGGALCDNGTFTLRHYGASRNDPMWPTVTISGTTISWYSGEKESFPSSYKQFNISNMTYQYMVWLQND